MERAIHPRFCVADRRSISWCDFAFALASQHRKCVVDVEGEGAEAKFTFAGAPKVATPDTPEDLAEAPTA
jgi:hypothetical protein